MSSQWKHKALTWAKPQTFQGLSLNTCNALGREALVMTLEADHGQLRLIFCRQHKSKFLVNSIYKAFPFVFKNPSCLFLGGTWFEFATWICIPQNCSSETPSTCFFFFKFQFSLFSQSTNGNLEKKHWAAEDGAVRGNCASGFVRSPAWEPALLLGLPKAGLRHLSYFCGSVPWHPIPFLTLLLPDNCRRQPVDWGQVPKAGVDPRNWTLKNSEDMERWARRITG